MSNKYYTLLPALRPILETLQKLDLWVNAYIRSTNDALYISSIVANQWPFLVLFIFGHRKKSHSHIWRLWRVEYYYIVVFV